MKQILNSLGITLMICLVATSNMQAQKNERALIRKGNRQFNDSAFVEADVNYRKALEINPQSTVAMYNLGNTLSQQNKLEDAIEQYADAARIEKDKEKLGEIYHNMGVIFQSQKQYEKAIEAYKHSLRNVPQSMETKYNLALAQKLLKDQQQQQQNQQQQKQEEQKQEEQKQEQQKQNKEEQQKQEQQQNQNQNQNSHNQEEMSKENAEQLLRSIMQDEKDVQEKVKKQQVMQGGKLEKDW